MEDQAAQHLGSGPVELELEGCYCAEVATAAADRPEEILVLGGRGTQKRPVRYHYIGTGQVVGGKAEAACEVSEAAAQRESRHTGGGYDPARYRQPEGLGLVVDIAPDATGIHVCSAPRWIDPNSPEPGQVDDQPVVAGGVAGDVMASTAHSSNQAMPSCDFECRHHICRSGAARHQSGATPDGAVPDRRGGLVAVVVRGNKRSPKARPQLADRDGRGDRHCSDLLLHLAPRSSIGPFSPSSPVCGPGRYNLWTCFWRRFSQTSRV